tara:strand:+ start:844 stop:1449 length:606 start_codon:yes stop_codon:yes gene_type:complete
VKLSATPRRWLIFLLALLPFLYLLQAVVRVQSGEWDLLGPEPGKAIVHFTGTWAFNFLLMTLAVSPLVHYLRWPWLMAHRRMLGLFSFFYVTLHGLAYFAFLLEWHWGDLGREIIERPYLLLGSLAWLLLLPLAVTSTRGWQRRLKRNWKKLHWLIYPAVLFASAHYLLQIRADWSEPVLYTSVSVALLLSRSWRLKRKTL